MSEDEQTAVAMDNRARKRTRPMRPLTPELRLARQAAIFGFGSLVVAAALGLSTVLFKALDNSEKFALWVVPVAVVLSVIGVISSSMGAAASWRAQRARASQEWNEHVEPLLRLPIRDGQFPLLNELADVELGVTPTRYTASGDDGYVARAEADRKRRSALSGSRPPFPFVLLHGDSKAGKSRTMVEAARHAWPGAPIIAPRDVEAVATLSRVSPPPSLETSPTLVWLDDLSSADLDYLSKAVPDAWSDSALIVGTMTTKRYQDALRTGSEVGAAARAALHRAIVYELPFDLSKEERAAAQLIYPHEKLCPLTDQPVSIGETLVAGDELVRKLRASRTDCPPGQAVAHAAVDARRAGLPRPITADELRRLFPLYLRQVNAGLTPTVEQFDIGLKWAATPVASQVAILQQADEEAWEALDYVVEAESGKHVHSERQMPDFLWSELLDATTHADAFAIGIAAHFARHWQVACNALLKAQQHPPTAAGAAFNLGLLLQDQGDLQGAQATYQRTVDSGHPRGEAKSGLSWSRSV